MYISTAPHTIGHKTTGHRYISAIQSVRASEDQHLRAIRHQKGMQSRVHRRGLIANNPPRGYTATRDPHTGAVTGYTFTPEIQIIQYITDQFLSGHSYTEIHRRLNATHPPPAGLKQWTYNSVHRALHNDTYAGFPSWSGRPAAEQSPLIPPLWDKDTHARIIAERTRRATGPYHRLGSGPLTGIIHCHRCTKPLSRYRDHRNRWYYRCPTHAKKHRTGTPCHPNHIPEPRAIRALTRHLSALATPAALDHALATIAQPAAHQTLTAELQRLTHTIHELNTQRRTIALDRAARKMSREIYHTTDTHLAQQLTAAEMRAAELQRQLQTLPDLAQQKKALASLASAFPALLQQAEPAEISTLLHTAGIRITCDSGRVHTITP